MRHARLTDRSVAALKPRPGRRVVRTDTEIPGFLIRITERNVRTWTFRYVRGDGTEHQVTLGTWPLVRAATARAKARELRERLEVHGIDPAQGRRRGALTLRELVYGYPETPERAALVGFLDDVKGRARPKTYQGYEFILRTAILPRWGRDSVAAITRAEVREMLAPIKQRGALAMWNAARACVGTLFAWAIEQELIDTSNPVRDIKRQKRTKRSRVLSDAELITLWKALTAPVPPIPLRLARPLVVQLLTACRPSEALLLHPQELDLAKGWWLIPAERAKNKVAHRLPLVPRLVTLLEAAVADARDPEWVFARGRGRAITRHAGNAITVLREAGLFPRDATRHDLRRTVTERLLAANVPREHVAAVLNHQQPGAAATTHYDHFKYDAQKQVALELWDRTLQALVTPGAAPPAVLSFTRP